jgi:2'-5' RNA ligase
VYKKYFIAIVPPQEIFQKIENIKLGLSEKFRLKGALRSPAHITLFRPFEWNEEKENELVNALAEFSFKRQFIIELKNFSCFQPRVIYVDVVKNTDLTDLHLELRGYCRRNFHLYNEDDDLRGFVPHVTIANRDLKKQLFYKLWDYEFRTRQFHAQFDYEGFSLLKLEAKWEIHRSFSI